MKIVGLLNDVYKSFRMEYDRKIVRKAMEAIDVPLKKNELSDEQNHRINFIMDNMLLHSGGHTSILRLATELYNLGYTIQYVYLNNQSKQEVENFSRCNLSSFKGKIVYYNEFDNNENDVVVATASNTVFSVMKMQGYKMYFVQDYEPTFFPLGDRYLLAKKTYEMGLHIVSLGKWNLNMIKRECVTCSKLDYIDFPCEITEYPYVQRDFSCLKDKKKIIIAAYIKTVGRRLPLVTQELLMGAKNILKEEGIDLEVRYFGEKKTIKCLGGENYGKLSKAELYKLYKEADFGYVASYSNVSLVPYEMISSGLPIIEIVDGSFSDFLPADCAILTDISSYDLADKIKDSILYPSLLVEKTNLGLNSIKDLSWRNSAIQFAKLIGYNIEE